MADSLKKDSNGKEEESFGYISVRPEGLDFETNMAEETVTGKLLENMKSNIFVPLGMLATAGFVAKGVLNMKTANRAFSNQLMRGRILSQMCTIVVLIVGTGYAAQATKVKRDEIRKQHEEATAAAIAAVK